MIDDREVVQALEADQDRPPRPPFLARLWMVFMQPGELFAALARNPAWFPVALLAAVMVAAGLAIVPADVFGDIAAERMRANPNFQVEGAETVQLPPIVFKAFAILPAILVTLLMPVLLSLVTWLIFIVIRGDRGAFKQHLCVFAHTGVILGFGGILHGIVVMRGGDLEQSLFSLGGVFSRFLADGVLLDFLYGMGLFNLWAAVVAAIGLAAVDPRRSAKPIAAVLIALTAVFPLVGALLASRFGG